VERTLLSAAFDLAFDFVSDFACDFAFDLAYATLALPRTLADGF
jgi:hypothetical protein